MTGKQKVLEILKDFDTWCLCGKKECAESVNFIQALDSIEEVHQQDLVANTERCIELMKEMAMENFHYRIMCGNIKDPEGKIDVHKAYVEFQALEPERKQFSDYIEKMRSEIRGADTSAKNQPNRGRWDSK